MGVLGVVPKSLLSSLVSGSTLTVYGRRAFSVAKNQVGPLSRFATKQERRLVTDRRTQTHRQTTANAAKVQRSADKNDAVVC